MDLQSAFISKEIYMDYAGGENSKFVRNCLKLKKKIIIIAQSGLFKAQLITLYCKSRSEIMLNSQMIPHILPSEASYMVSVVSILD